MNTFEIIEQYSIKPNKSRTQDEIDSFNNYLPNIERLYPGFNPAFTDVITWMMVDNIVEYDLVSLFAVFIDTVGKNANRLHSSKSSCGNCETCDCD